MNSSFHLLRFTFRGNAGGALPKRQQRSVEAWAELHQAELMADWDRLQTGHKPWPIAPLT